MMRRKWMLALIFLVIGNLRGQETVFVNLEQLASLHPAWQLAVSISRKPKPEILSWLSPTLSLTDLPLLAPKPQLPQLADWLEEQKRKWANELELIQKQHQQILAGQIHLLLPPLPLLDPVARWKFTVQQIEKQFAERVRLNLRLSFADMLSPEEKSALERRKRELDLELEPAPAISQPLLIPLFPTEKMDLTPPTLLTEPQTIFDLVTPPVSPPREPLKVHPLGAEGPTLSPLSDSAAATLRSIAAEAVKNFVVAYARQRGWKVTFSFRPNLPDVTDEIKRAWRQWLGRIQLKE